MFLRKLILTYFKNYSSQQLSFIPDVNLVYGRNGSGKTNLFDAINYLAMSKSYFSLTDRQLILDGRDVFRIEGVFEKDGKPHQVVVKYKAGGSKEIELNKSKLGSVSDLIGKFPVVLIAPGDSELVYDASHIRRKFIDRILCQADSDYLGKLMRYNRILRQKNAHLKSERLPDRNLINVFNQKLSPLNDTIHQVRASFLSKFIPVFVENYRMLSSGKEYVGIEYRSDLNGGSSEVLFSGKIDQEIEKRRPLAGIQRDDFEFEIGSKALKKFGSQGQVKTFIYALRLAEFHYLREATEITPVLILDDFFEKLDQHRLERLIALISGGSFGQVFLSDTERNRAEEIFQSVNIVYSCFHVKEGKIDT